ncbi:MAG: OmpH family outer membrane protein [Vicingaceae bacterium]
MRNTIHLIVSSLAVVGVVVLFLTKNQQGNGHKIAYVESLKLMEHYPPMKKLSEEVKIKTTVVRARIDSIQGAIQMDMASLEARRGTMPLEQQQSAFKELQEKEQKARQYAEQVQRKLQADNQEVLKEMMNRVNAHVKEYGEEHDFQIILGASGNGNLAYADKAIDITDELIDELNSSL